MVPVPPSTAEVLSGPHAPLVAGYLDWQRETLISICAGLSGEQLVQRPLPPSRLSLLGLLRHMTKVERIWFRQRARGESVAGVFDDFPEGNHDFESLNATDARAALSAFEQECAASRRSVAGMDLDDEVDVHGETVSLLMIYVHMIGEYARHNGHADLLREQIDGVTGR